MTVTTSTTIAAHSHDELVEAYRAAAYEARRALRNYHDATMDSTGALLREREAFLDYQLAQITPGSDVEAASKAWMSASCEFGTALAERDECLTLAENAKTVASAAFVAAKVSP